jgi:SAM-dependent methyltransferase
LLDPRPENIARSQPIQCAVNIPAGEIAKRVVELPPKGEAVKVAQFQSWSEEAVRELIILGRRAEATENFDHGENPTRTRLWRPNPFLEENLSRERGRALDLGCGTGRDAVFIASAGWQVDAADVLPDALERGEELAKRYLARPETVRFFQSDLREPIGGEMKYDLITCFFFISRTGLEQIHQLIAPGGLFLFETFSRMHQERYGKPKGDQATTAAEVAELLGASSLEASEAWHGDRHTVRILAKF